MFQKECFKTLVMNNFFSIQRIQSCDTFLKRTGKSILFKYTVIPCTGMQCIKTQVLGNRCTIKRAFWPYFYLDPSRILEY